MKTKISILALAALSFASCNNNNEILQKSNFPTDRVIRVATSVTTRAGLTTQNLNNMGLHVINSNSTTYSYKNVKMSYVDNDWSSETNMLWQSSNQNVKIIAYSPYIENANDPNVLVPFAVKANQSKEENIKVSDFVYQSLDFTPALHLESGKVNLLLKHTMSKLAVTIKLGTELNETPGTTTNPIESVTVNGTKTKCNLNFQNSSVVEELLDDVESVLMYQESYTSTTEPTNNSTAEYQCILLPQSIEANALTIDIYIKGKGNYKYTLPNSHTFETGKIYTIKLNVGNNMVTSGSMTMAGWISGNDTGDNYETE